MNGKLIVLDGLDGCGKSTQFERIKNYLNETNQKYKAISFPEYDKPSSALIKMYLGGEISANANDINAYAASSFYAVDRYVSYKKYWEENYKNGELILASRYITSNAIHQMAKMDKSLWDDFIKWLFDYECNKLGMPYPDTVIFLDMPTSVSQKLLLKRYDGDENKKDIHESNIDYLNACRESALYAASKLGWKVVKCSQDNEPLPIEVIAKNIQNIIKESL